MKKRNMQKFGGGLLVLVGLSVAIAAAAKSGTDGLARTNTKAPVSEKQAMLNEIFPSNPGYGIAVLFGAVSAIIGMGLINKSKEK